MGDAPILGVTQQGDLLPIPYPDVAYERWTGPGEFAALFEQFVTTPGDPEVLLVTGNISQNGTASIDQLDRIAAGTVSQPPPGDGSVQVLDASGSIVTEVPFTVDFRLLTDPPITLNTAPFSFAVSYPPNAAQVQIVHTGQILARINVTTKLLYDAVASIPDAGFTQNPDQRRNALFSKIAALDQQLAAGDLTGARNNLQNDIRNILLDSHYSLNVSVTH